MRPQSTPPHATKQRRSGTTLLLSSLLCLWMAGAVQGQGTPGNRRFNPFQAEFRRAWEVAFTDPVKLIEVGATATDKSPSNLVLMVEGRDKSDFRRQLRVTRWNGFQFVPEYTTDFLGTQLDTLLLGRFRTGQVKASTQSDKGKKPPPPPTRQIVTTEGVYEWTGAGYSRIFSAPLDLKLALMLEGTPDHLLNGMGNTAQLYEIGETDVHSSAIEPPTEGEGYVRMGIGLQDFPAASQMEITAGVRFVQSYWNSKQKWYLAVQRGTPAPTPDLPNATTGDRLIVYTPKFSMREKSFWSIKPDEMEESWRSDPFAGRLLDVRVGDPKNEGKVGILVLLASPDGKERRLLFYAVASPGGGR